MKYLKFISISCFLLALNSPLQAVVIGDKDWMQVSDVASYSWNDLDLIFDTTTGLCDSPSCLLGGTIDLTGYKWASSEEALEMIADVTSAYTGHTDPNDHVVNVGPGVMEAFFDKFTATINTSSYKQLYGWTRDSKNATSYASGIGTTDYTDVNTDDWVFLVTDYLKYERRPPRGAFLYKEAQIPEPATLLLFCAGLAGIGRIHQKHRQGVI